MKTFRQTRIYLATDGPVREVFVKKKYKHAVHMYQEECLKEYNFSSSLHFKQLQGRIIKRERERERD